MLLSLLQWTSTGCWHKYKFHIKTQAEFSPLQRTSQLLSGVQLLKHITTLQESGWCYLVSLDQTDGKGKSELLCTSFQCQVHLSPVHINNGHGAKFLALWTWSLIYSLCEWTHVTCPLWPLAPHILMEMWSRFSFQVSPTWKILLMPLTSGFSKQECIQRPSLSSSSTCIWRMHSCS